MRSISINDAIKNMNNYMYTHESEFGYEVLCGRMPCNDELSKHPSIRIGWHDKSYTLSMLGLINGIFGIDKKCSGPIARNSSSEFIRLDTCKIPNINVDKKYSLSKMCDETHMIEIFEEALQLDPITMIKFFLSDIGKERLRFLSGYLFDNTDFDLYDELHDTLVKVMEARRELEFDGDVLSIDGFLANVSNNKNTIKKLDQKADEIERKVVTEQIARMIESRKAGIIPCRKLNTIGEVLKRIKSIPEDCMIGIDTETVSSIVISFKGDR